MSLINDALKKAQRQRTGEAPPLSSMPGVGGETAARIAKRGKPAGFNTQLIRLGMGAGGLILLVIGGYFVLRGKSEARPDAGQAATVGGAVASPPQTAVAPPPAADPIPRGPEPSSPSFVLPVAPKTAEPAPMPKSAPVVAASPPAAPASPVAQPAGTQLPAPVSPPPQMENKAITYIENLRIAGIRASTTDAKVLMNDRVYRHGDMVERELGLRLVGITSGSLTFEDERGARYTRSF